jgi:hypothetical protein
MLGFHGEHGNVIESGLAYASICATRPQPVQKGSSRFNHPSRSTFAGKRTVEEMPVPGAERWYSGSFYTHKVDKRDPAGHIWYSVRDMGSLSRVWQPFLKLYVNEKNQVKHSLRITPRMWE